MRTIPDDWLREAVAASKAYPSMQAAADALKIPRKTFADRLKIAARKGLYPVSPAAMPGFEISQVSVEQDGAWVKQRPEHGAPFKVPKGHVVNGVSALVDPDERVIAKWVKTKAGVDSTSLVDAVIAAMKNYDGAALLTPCPLNLTTDLLTLYPITDHHLGMHAWGKETGEDYDLKIAADTLKASVSELIYAAPASEVGIVLNLGDFMHADNQTNMTPRGGNLLDVDGRYAKILMTGVELLRDAIQLALQKHAHVIARMLAGNHDPHVSVALAIALKMFFANEPRVLIDCDPSLYWYYQFGRTMLAAHHGHEAKPSQMPGIMAAGRSKMWGDTAHRFAFIGHEHHSSKGGGEHAGATWEVLQASAPRDGFAAGKGYFSGRSMTAITFHRERGFYSRINKTLG